jgi:hypothetical protein
VPDEIDPEDRDKLVDLKFGELFDRHWERKFGEEFDKRVNEMTKTRKPQASQQQPEGQQEPQRTGKQRKYSLLDKAIGLA